MISLATLGEEMYSAIALFWTSCRSAPPIVIGVLFTCSKRARARAESTFYFDARLLMATIYICAVLIVILIVWAARFIAYRKLTIMTPPSPPNSGDATWLKDLFQLVMKHRKYHIEADYELVDFKHMESYNSCVLRSYPWSSPLSAIIEMADIRDGMHVLDIGCGTGAFAAYACKMLPNVTFTCVANSKSLVAEVKARATRAGFSARIHPVLADFDHWVPKEAAFDRVVSLESMGYSRDRLALLARLHRALAPGGKLYVKTPTFKSGSVSWGDAAQLMSVWQYNFSHANSFVADMRACCYRDIRMSSYSFYVNALFFNLFDWINWITCIFINGIRLQDHAVHVMPNHPLHSTHIIATRS
jgi:SAM-dependent methyltransferase